MLRFRRNLSGKDFFFHCYPNVKRFLGYPTKLIIEIIMEPTVQYRGWGWW